MEVKLWQRLVVEDRFLTTYHSSHMKTGGNLKTGHLYCVQGFSCQVLPLISYRISIYQNSAQFSSFFLVICMISRIKFFALQMDVHHPKITAHLTSSFLGIFSCTSSYIIACQSALVPPPHTSSLLARFVSSLLCYRICLHCSLIHYISTKYK